MISKRVDELMRDGRLEKVPVDYALARRMLRTATRNLDAIERIATEATELAYTGAYDATRLAITAHMAANGIRLTNRPGAHVAVMQYGQYQLGGIVSAETLDGLDQMRRVRNDTEEVRDAERVATTVTRAVARHVLIAPE